MTSKQMKPEERLVAGFVGIFAGGFALAYGQPIQKVVIGGFGMAVLVIALLGRNPLAGGEKE